MRVLVDVSALGWPIDSGIPRFVEGLTGALCRRLPSETGLSVNWIRAGRHPIPERAGPLGHLVRSVRLPYAVVEHLRFGLRIFPRSYDLYHGPAQEFAFAPLGRRVIVTVHDLGPVVVPHFYPKHTRTRFRWLLRRLSAEADCVLTDTEAIRSEVVDIGGIEAARVRVVKPGIDQSFFRSDQSAFSPDASEPYFILFAGSVQPRKNLETLIQAFSALVRSSADFGQLNLVLLGSTGWGAGAEAGIAARCGVANRVKRIGHVDRKLVPGYFTRAAAVVVPSFYEGFGFPVLEAMASGTPVIVSRTPALIEVGGDAVQSFRADDSEELRSLLHQVLTDSGLRRTMVAAGRRRAGAFNWDAAAVETLSIYRELGSAH